MTLISGISMRIGSIMTFVPQFPLLQIPLLLVVFTLTMTVMNTALSKHFVKVWMLIMHSLKKTDLRNGNVIIIYL